MPRRAPFTVRQDDRKAQMLSDAIGGNHESSRTIARHDGTGEEYLDSSMTSGQTKRFYHNLGHVPRGWSADSLQGTTAGAMTTPLFEIRSNRTDRYLELHNGCTATITFNLYIY